MVLVMFVWPKCRCCSFPRPYGPTAPFASPWECGVMAVLRADAGPLGACMPWLLPPNMVG